MKIGRYLITFKQFDKVFTKQIGIKINRNSDIDVGKSKFKINKTK